MIEFLAITSLCLVAILSMLAVLSDVVKDNLVERIGLTLICFAALGRAVVLHMEGGAPLSAMLLHMSICVYALGSAWEKFKLWLTRPGSAEQPLPEPFSLAAGQSHKRSES